MDDESATHNHRRDLSIPNCEWLIPKSASALGRMDSGDRFTDCPSRSVPMGVDGRTGTKRLHPTY